MLIDTEEKAVAAYEVLARNPGAYTVDTETSGITPYSAKDPSRICGVAIGWADTPEHDSYWTFRHKEGENLPISWLHVLLTLLNGREIRGHNLKFDVHMCLVEQPGLFKIPTKFKCSQIAAHTAQENFRFYALKKLHAELFGAHTVKSSDELMKELRKRKAGKGEIHRLPAAKVVDYAIDDLRLHRNLLQWAEKEVARWGLTDILEERYQYQLALIRIEQRGMPISVEETQRQIEEIQPKLADYKARLWKLQQAVGLEKPINLNSHAQLKSWLKLKSTKKEVLLEILKSTPREDLQTLLDYRFVTKAEGTYFRPFLEMMDAEGRLHTGFKVTGTVTWRLSSAEPNLQNCSPFVKKCFVAPPGYKYVELDFSAIEPRIAAHLTRDPDLIDTFHKGQQFHATTARKMYKVQGPIDKESKIYKDAKILGLGAIYNLGSYKMARSLGLRHDKDKNGGWVWHDELVWSLNLATEQLYQRPCSEQDPEYCTCLGKKARKDFFYAIPSLEPTIKAVQATAKRNKYIRVPLFGTVQRFDKKRGRNGFVKSFNAAVQHMAAMILMRALLAVDKHLGERSDISLIGSVHDSLILLVKDDEHLDQKVGEVKWLMENQTKLLVPLVAEAKVGVNLGQLKDRHVQAKEPVSNAQTT